MKKLVLAVCAVALSAAALVGCAAQDTAEEGTAGMPNPIVAVDGIQAITDQLGINIDLSKLTSAIDPDFSVIDGKMAQVTWNMTNPADETVTCTLRATLDAEAAESMAGVYDDNMTAGEPKEIAGITINVNEAPSVGATCFDWQIGPAYFSFVIDGELGNLPEVMEQLIAATSAE